LFSCFVHVRGAAQRIHKHPTVHGHTSAGYPFGGTARCESPFGREATGSRRLLLSKHSKRNACGPLKIHHYRYKGEMRSVALWLEINDHLSACYDKGGVSWLSPRMSDEEIFIVISSSWMKCERKRPNEDCARCVMPLSWIPLFGNCFLLIVPTCYFVYSALQAMLYVES